MPKVPYTPTLINISADISCETDCATAQTVHEEQTALSREESLELNPPPEVTNEHDCYLTHPLKNPAQEAPHTTEPPAATLLCEEPPELDPPPAEPPD